VNAPLVTNGGVSAGQESGKSQAPRPVVSMTHLTETVPYATSGGETGPGKTQAGQPPPTGGAPGWQEKIHGEASGNIHGGKNNRIILRSTQSCPKIKQRASAWNTHGRRLYKAWRQSRPGAQSYLRRELPCLRAGCTTPRPIKAARGKHRGTSCVTAVVPRAT